MGGRFGDQFALAILVELALAFGVGSSMAHNLVAARATGRHEIGRVVVHRAVDQGRHRQVERVESIEHVPGADPVAVIAPGEVEHVGLRPAGRQFGAKALAEGKMLQVEGEIDGKPAAARP